MLPAELQDINAFVYTAGMSPSGEQANAKALIDYMTEAANLIRSKGMNPAGDF